MHITAKEWGGGGGGGNCPPFSYHSAWYIPCMCLLNDTVQNEVIMLCLCMSYGINMLVVCT